MSDPDNLVLKLLREVRSEVGDIKSEVSDVRANMATRDQLADARASINSLRADVASDLLLLEKRMNDRFAHLNRTVTGYHSSVVGHGLLVSEIDERLRRVEEHLKLPPDEKH